MNIGIIGSGNVGITTAFAIAEKGSGHVLLYDKVEGRAKGKALDLAEAAPLRRYGTRIEGTDNFDDLMLSDILVIAAGSPRQANMSRVDLLDENLPLIHELADAIKSGYRKPDPPIVILLTEPVDLMTLAFIRRSGYPRERVLGVGGLLSSARMRYFIAKKLNISPEDIDAMVVGTHGDKMAVLERYTRISGLPLSFFLDREQIDSVVKQTIDAGHQIVEQAKIGSSFYTPGAAVGAMVDAISRDLNRVMGVSVKLTGEFGIENQCLSVPTMLGRNGVKRIFELKLNEQERAALHASAKFQEPYLSRV